MHCILNGKESKEGWLRLAVLIIAKKRADFATEFLQKTATSQLVVSREAVELGLGNERDQKALKATVIFLK